MTAGTCCLPKPTRMQPNGSSRGCPREPWRDRSVRAIIDAGAGAFVKRRLTRIPLLSLLSTLLLIAAIVLWVRSRHHADVATFLTPAGHLQGISNDPQGVLLCFSNVPFGSDMGLSIDALSASSDDFQAIHDLLLDPNNVKWKLLGVRLASVQFQPWGWTMHALLLPYWMPIVLLAILPFLRLRRIIVRIIRSRRGQCLNCGYDLRASPGVCPECGVGVGGASKPPDVATAIVSWLCLGLIIAAIVCLLCRGRKVGAMAATQPPEAALLDRLVEEVNSGPASPDEAIQSLARAAGTRIAVDWNAVQTGSLLPDARLQLYHVRLGSALRALCERPGGLLEHNDVQVWVSDGSVHVGADRAAPVCMRSYPVGDLLPLMKADPPRPSNADYFFSDAPKELDVAEAIVAEQRDQLAALIENMALADEWLDNGGSIGNLYVFGNRLWVLQTQQGHAGVRAVLDALRFPQSPNALPPNDSAGNPQSDLKQHIVELNLGATTLGSAFEAIARQTRSNIVVHWALLHAMGLDRDTPLRLNLSNLTLEQALDVVQAVAGAPYRGMAVGQDGVIVIDEPEILREGSAFVRVYDVRDLTAAYCATHHPMPRQLTNDVRDPWRTETDPADDALELLSNNIEKIVQSDSWNDNGGSIGRIAGFNGMLVIRQTPSAHREITELLRQIRAGAGGLNPLDSGRNADHGPK